MPKSSINVRIGANLKEFSTKLQTAHRKLQKFGRSMEKTGRTMSRNLTLPLVGLGALSVKAFAEQEQALAKLSAQITQSGLDVETTLPKYEKFAAELQKITTVGDEVTLGLIQMAMTMGSKAPENAAQNAIALSKALGVDLNSSIKMVTLAEKGEYTMLNRYVPALRQATTETEKAAIVSKLYADGLEIAKAEANTSTGKLMKLKNTFGDLMETIGGTIASAIMPLVERLKTLTERFQGLSESQVQTIVKIAGIVAAIGPALFIIGKLIKSIKSLAIMFNFLAANPIIAIISAIALLIMLAVKLVKNWDSVKGFFKKLWLNIKLIFLKGIKAIVTPLEKLLETLNIEVKGFEKLQASIDSTRSELNKVKSATVDASESMEDAAVSTDNLNKSVETTIPNIQDFGGAVKDLNAQINEYVSSGNYKMAVGLIQQAQSAEIAKQKTEDFIEVVKSLNSGMDKVAVGGNPLSTGGVSMPTLTKAEKANKSTTSQNTDAFKKQSIALATLKDSVLAYSEALGSAITSAKNMGEVIRQLAKDFIEASVAKAVAAMIEKSVTTLGPLGLAIAPAAGAAAAALFDKLVPQFALGTSSARGGLSLVGERGAEFVNLPRGSQVHTNDMSRNMMRGQQEILVSEINMDTFRVMLQRNTTRNNTRRG